MKKAIPNKWAISLALTTGVVRCNVWTMVLLLCHDAFKLCGFWFWIGYQYALLPEAGPSPPHSQAGTLVAIHKSGQAGKAVISAGMPKSRPWTVASRLYKCLIQVTCQPVASWTWIQGHLSRPIVCHPWTLDFGIPAEKTGLQHLCITTRAWAWEPAQWSQFRFWAKETRRPESRRSCVGLTATGGGQPRR